ncbi:hypothetical protein [uncultured Algoriphagus sp.]|uniref:hypothetical protein n=1 Tax=uncultured Algoriphagus sp. TaxID=417365 RepID=UPI0030ECF41F|tara:strand:- start:23 stop:1183 length:1161 start_codon:yes stop_codon:yes gene_type:complete
MRKYLIFIVLSVGYSNAIAQTSEKTASTSKDLAVPFSPAFSITDITPSLVQNPTTPKAFTLGVAQSATAGSSYFPDNYSAQFAPIWWIDPSGISIYSYLGLDLPKDGEKLGDNTQHNIFSGLKFSTMSIGFVNKDLIPDNLDETQNIFSIGVHSTFIKFFKKEHIAKLQKEINQWHINALTDLERNQALIDAITRIPLDDSLRNEKIDDLTKQFTQTNSLGNLKNINKLISEKPIFTWDLSAAIAGYGVSSDEIKTGRMGVWTGLATNLKLKENTQNYFSINVLGRYLYDQFQANDEGIIGSADNIDVGGNLGFEFDRLNISVESLYRFTNGVANSSNRTIGLISVKLTDNLFINGTFGKDFSGPNKLISTFGINWGFGNEKIKLP